MSQAFEMKVTETFVVGDKIIFEGSLQTEVKGECKGPADLLMDGEKCLRFQVEGEVFDDTPEPALWSYATEELRDLKITGHEVVIASVV